MKRGRVLAIGVALLAASQAHADLEEFWVDYETGVYLVGEIETDPTGRHEVVSAFLTTGENALYLVPFKDRRAGGLLDLDLVEQYGGYAVLQADQIHADRVLLTGVWVNHVNAPGGNDGTTGDGSPGEPDGGGTGTTLAGGPYEAFTAVMIFDDEQSQWEPILLLKFEEAMQAILASFELLPRDWGQGVGGCPPPGPSPGSEGFRTVVEPWLIVWEGNPEQSSENGLTVYPLHLTEGCFGIQTLPDAPDPGDGPGNVDWILLNYPRFPERPSVGDVPPLAAPFRLPRP